MPNLHPDYLPYPGQKDTTVYAQSYNRDQIMYLQGDTVANHTHDFVEITYVKQGICQHIHKDLTAFLTSGDILIIPPNQYHTLVHNHQITYYNCQFYPQFSRPYLNNLLKDMYAYRKTAFAFEKNNAMAIFDSENGNIDPSNAIALKRQGVLHLNSSEMSYVEFYLQSIISEQNNLRYGSDILMQNFAEAILIAMLRNAQNQPTQELGDLVSNKKKNIITHVLTHIEQNYEQEIDFEKIAQSHKLTKNYFCLIFKQVTGTTPTKYINRFRVLKALELLQTTNLTIVDIAYYVGFYDASYFSRVFGNLMGYPPSYYKSIINHPSKP